MAAVLVLAGLTGCSHPEPLPRLGTVPNFVLTDQSGKQFAGSSLTGHVWIADFIYTNCPGPCPLMTKRLHEIEDQLSGEPSLRFASFSVDPARDTPPVLAAYARRFHASSDRWTFLTGDPQTLDALDWNTFHLGHLSAAFDHSTRFILIDRKRTIRGYYGMGQDNMTEHIVADAIALSKERS